MAAASVHLASQRLQHSFAGNTTVDISQPGTPSPPSAHEVAYGSTIQTELESVFSGGFHPESVITAISQPASRAIERASNSVRGPKGGLVPKAGTVYQTGPAGAAIMAQGKAFLSKLGLVK